MDELVDEALRRCDLLAECSETPGEITRTFLRPPMRRVHAYLHEWMSAAGLDVRIDAMGNVIGRRNGGSQRVFAVGSHVDTVPNAGRYDGVLGVMLGIAALQGLQDRQLARTIDVIAFSEEEGVRFRTPFLGSLAVCGRIDPGQLATCDADGVTLAKSIRDFGLNPDQLAAAAYAPNDPMEYFEVHIEQGPVLDSKNVELGIVTAIAGQSRFVLTFTGQAGHAGTQPMELRRDALAAAAEWMVGVEQLARATDGLRATIGSVHVSPGASNVVPGQVRLSLDIRHEDDGARRRAAESLLRAALEIGARRRIDIDSECALDKAAMPCDGATTHRLERAVAECGYGIHRLVSGAGHDAAVMATRSPVAMLFVRSPGGISHHPDESVKRGDVRAALEVMIRFLTTELERE